jgi:hypothetical protein
MLLSTLYPCSYLREGARKASRGGGMPTLHGQILCLLSGTTDL